VLKDLNFLLHWVVKTAVIIEIIARGRTDGDSCIFSRGMDGKSAVHIISSSEYTRFSQYPK
jgi:hypothetical protein